MKKILKKGIAMLLIGLVAISGLQAYAAASIKVDKKTYIYVESQRQTKFHTTKGYAYCITPNRTGPEEGRTLTLKSTQSKGGVLYLLDKTGTSDNEFLVTQLAIWLFESNHMPDFYWEHSNLEVVKKAKALAAEAAKNNNYTHAPSVKLTTSSESLSITSDNKYYRSGAITVTIGNASEATLALEGAPAGATIVNSQYKAITKAANNTKIYVQIPEENVKNETTFSIKATVNGKISEVERYTTGDSKIQELVVLVRTDKTVNYIAKQKVTPVKRSCDEVNGKYYNKKGEVVDKIAYSIDCEPHTCEPVGSVYFGKKGTQVSFEEYTKECVHKCEKYDNKYYGEQGTEVTEAEFTKQCVHKCEFYGNKYYGEQGTEVTEAEYTKQCVHKCEIYNNQYYGVQGTVVTEAEYTKQCVHKCEFYNNQYYGSLGTIVTEAEFKNQCETPYVPVPDTDASQEWLYILLGTIILGSSIGVITHKKNA